MEIEKEIYDNFYNNYTDLVKNEGCYNLSYNIYRNKNINYYDLEGGKRINFLRCKCSGRFNTWGEIDDLKYGEAYNFFKFCNKSKYDCKKYFNYNKTKKIMDDIDELLTKNCNEFMKK